MSLSKLAQQALDQDVRREEKDLPIEARYNDPGRMGNLLAMVVVEEDGDILWAKETIHSSRRK